MENDWVECSESLPETHTICRVRTESGDETDAYFYTDKMGWIEFYGRKPCHFWNRLTHEAMHDVTHWRER